MKRFVLVLMLGVSMLTLAACNTQKAPDQETADAKNALNAAKTAYASAGVDPAANPNVKGAEDKLNQAVGEIDTQGKKFSFTRDYKNAKALLMDSKAMSDKALVDAKAAAEAAAAQKAAAEKAAAAKKKGKGKKK